MKERDLQKRIIRRAETMGWRPFHQYNSQHSNPGFPDLHLAFGPDPIELPEGIDSVDYWSKLEAGLDTSSLIPITSKIVVAELKTTRSRYGVTDDQAFWLHCYKMSGVSTFVWTELHLPDIPDILGRLARPLWSYPEYDAYAAHKRRIEAENKSKTPF